MRKFEKRFEEWKRLYKQELIDREKIIESFEGWLAYISHANTYKYSKHITRLLNQCFPVQPVIKFNAVRKHESFIKKVDKSNVQFSAQKTLYLFRKNRNIKQIAEQRNIKESTVWEHLANLIEFNQISVWKVLPKQKIYLIKPKIYSEHDKLKDIKNRIKDNSVTYDEINSVLASIKARNRTKNICYLINWYKRICCYRKCYLNLTQRKECKIKFNFFISKNPKLEMKKKDFVDLFNNHLKICVLPEQDKRKYLSWKEFVERRKK